MNAAACRISVLLIAAVLLLASTPQAGENAGGSAYLSWDVAGLDTVVTSVPARPFPLYLQLVDARHVAQLGATIVWTTDLPDSLPCMQLASADPPPPNVPTDSLYGWVIPAEAPSTFQGDPNYTWVVNFVPSDSLRSRIAFSVDPGACQVACNVTFEIRSIITLDSNNQLDTLHVRCGAHTNITANLECPHSSDRWL